MRFHFLSIPLILILMLMGVLPWAYADAPKEARPIYEKINEFRTVKHSTLLWGDINEVFVRAKVSTVAAYPGEPITLTYDLLSRLDTEAKGMESIENAEEFGKVVIPESYLQHPVRRSLFFKDKQYRQETIRKVVLFARTSGEKEIIPGSVQAIYFVKKQDPPQSLLLKGAETLKVTVKDFPELGRPENFSGLAGDFKVRTWADLKDYDAEGVAKVVVEISGTGDLASYSLPLIEWPEGLTFKNKTDEMTVSFRDQDVLLRKTFIISVVPERTGEFLIPAIRLSFFSPEVRKYKEVSSKPVTMEIKELAAVSTPAWEEKSEETSLSKESLTAAEELSAPQELPVQKEEIAAPAAVVEEAVAAVPATEIPADPLETLPSTPTDVQPVLDAASQLPEVSTDAGGQAEAVVAEEKSENDEDSADLSSSTTAVGTTVPSVPAGIQDNLKTATEAS